MSPAVPSAHSTGAGFDMTIRFLLSLSCLVTDNDNSCHQTIKSVVIVMLVSDDSLLSFLPRKKSYCRGTIIVIIVIFTTIVSEN